MDDLESRLDHQLSGLGRVPLAEPVAVDDLRRRARHVRFARAATSVVAVVAAIAVTSAVVVVARDDSSTVDGRKVQIAAPDFILGDIDAVVLSQALDADGARQPLPVSLTAVVAGLPGVESVNGVVDTFAPRSADEGVPTGEAPPRSPILFSYHKGDRLNLMEGETPNASDEIMVDADFLSRENVAIGDFVTLAPRGQEINFRIVGRFELPGIDLTGVPLAAMAVAYQPSDLALDRLDVKLTAGANPARVRDRIAAAVGSAYAVVPPSVISFPDQRLAQIEIQRAYWALLSPDPEERALSGDGPPSDQEKANYEKYRQLAKMVELRVQNVAFLSPDAAALTYRIYYGSGPSPIIKEPQSGSAARVDGHWQLGLSTLCSLAALVSIKCEGAENVTISPPNGYEPLSTLEPEVVNAFNTLANPKATADQRAAVVAGGNTGAIRQMIEDGVRRDASAGETTLTIAGWKQVSPTQIELLYSLLTDGPSTPYPTTTSVEKGADGHWYAPVQYACGINGLAGGGCYAEMEATAPAVATSP